ncbi:MAG TPA: transglycosylase SLT domain-containing protein [Solirubrobacterales bacterium]|nr:transglycosylase SLT domain-containing protein [Solirubrobacterales bacterium]
MAHTVDPGESLWSIAAEDGIGVDELAAANGLSPGAGLVSGTTVLIPPSPPPSSAGPVAGDSAASGSGECVWRCRSSVHPHPTDETLTAGEIGDIGAEYGMSPSLVEAMARNESGFDNAQVSSAGARGVMQVIPDTWNFVEDQLADRPLDPASARANVEAGVIYLHHLYHLAGGDPQATVASYFQGPNRDTLLPQARDYLRKVRDDEADFGR